VPDTMEAQCITFALKDHAGGFETSPERVCLGDLARFADDVLVFLRGDSKEVDAQGLEVAVLDGSLAIQTTPLMAAPRLFADLRMLLDGELIQGIEAKRREVIERWQKSARNARHLSYKISAPFLDRAVIVSADTDYRADDADQWVHVERYIRGEVQNLGGVTKSNAHVRLQDGSTLTVATNKDLLRNDKENRLYKTAMLRIRAEYNVLTRELRAASLVEFVEYASNVDEEELARLTRRGASAWKDVGSSTAWVDGLRGGKH
jgi:hypothetical protein